MLQFINNKTFMWTYSNDAGDFDLELTRKDIMDCSHSGSCDKDCERVSQKEYVRSQLQDVSDDVIAKTLALAGVDVADKTERKELCKAIVWDAACNLREDFRFYSVILSVMAASVLHTIFV